MRLYGSRACGDFRPDGDFDLAVVLHSPRGDIWGMALVSTARKDWSYRPRTALYGKWGHYTICQKSYGKGEHDGNPRASMPKTGTKDRLSRKI